MAVVNSISTTLTNNRASPPVKNDNRNSGGRLRVKSETHNILSGDSNTSTFRYFKMKAHDVIKSIVLYNDAMATSAATIDIGGYVEGAGGAAVDINAWGAAIAINTAVTVGTEIRFEALNITTINDQVWQNLGVSTEPAAGTEYDLTLTVLARGSTPVTGDVVLVVTYAAGD